MTYHALISLQPHAPVAPTPHGLLLSPNWWVWLAYALVLPMAWCLMPGQLRESVKALWEPWERFIASLRALSAILEGLVVFTCSFGVVAVWRGWMVPVDDAPKLSRCWPGGLRPALQRRT